MLLNDVENGTIVLIGATTENPFFTINSPLLSRSTVFKFAPLGGDEIRQLLRRALADEQRGLGGVNVEAPTRRSTTLRRSATATRGGR